MRYNVVALYICLSHVAFASQADVLAALKNQEIPLAAQVLSGEELVKYLQKNQNFFEADVTPHSHNVQHKLMDLRFVNQNRKPVVENADDEDDDIPESFDARTHWANCTSLRHIRDQANCGSCWAVSTASALSDRICIASKGETQLHISSIDIVSCCKLCGYGCDGGWPIEAFDYFSRQGAVTGETTSKDGCRPYPFHPLWTYGNDTVGRRMSGRCKHSKTVGEGVKRVTRNHTRRTGLTARRLRITEFCQSHSEGDHGNGPVVAVFTVYEDFSYYKKGIYVHIAGKARGAHAIKIIGWGVENGLPYWLIANSWHDDWGEQGLFRIVRGINECGIEQEVVAGHVLL
uniref:Cysteine proteinase n=1 Tax=Haemonchus contortus TaxID=6289 RepID=Q94573_HAECO|nr:cysteine proteinase [Haemonchus contortus]